MTWEQEGHFPAERDRIKRPPIVSEFCIQSTFIECLAHLKPHCVYFAVPNEAKRSLAGGARMKKLGNRSVP